MAEEKKRKTTVKYPYFKDFQEDEPLGLFLIEQNREKMESVFENFEKFHPDKIFCISWKLRNQKKGEIIIQERATDGLVEEIVLGKGREKWFLKSAERREPSVNDVCVENYIFSKGGLF